MSDPSTETVVEFGRVNGDPAEQESAYLKIILFLSC